MYYIYIYMYIYILTHFSLVWLSLSRSTILSKELGSCLSGFLDFDECKGCLRPPQEALKTNRQTKVHLYIYIYWYIIVCVTAWVASCWWVCAAMTHRCGTLFFLALLNISMDSIFWWGLCQARMFCIDSGNVACIQHHIHMLHDTTYVYMYIYIYIVIYQELEREREGEM